MARFGLVGGTYQSESISIDAQRCMNWYPEANESGAGVSLAQLYPTPGLKLFPALAGNGGGGGTTSPCTYNLAAETVSITCPAGSWTGYNFPALADAGNYVLGWGGYTYNFAESGAPFRLNIVKMTKNPFAVALQANPIMGGLSQFLTTSWLTVDVPNGFVYCGCWAPHAGHTSFDYSVVVLDLATLTQQAQSNIVNIPNPGIQQGDTQSQSSAFVVHNTSGHAFVVAQSWSYGYVWIYNVSSNSLSLLFGNNTGSLINNGGIQCGPTTAAYYMMLDANDTIYVIPDVTASTPTSSVLATIPLYTVNTLTRNQSQVMYISQDGHSLYVLGYGTGEGVIQIDTATGAVTMLPAISGVDNTHLLNFAGSAQAGMQGAIPVEDSHALVLGSVNIATGVFTNLLSIPAVDFWDAICTVPDPGQLSSCNPVYATPQLPDLSAGQTWTWYKYTSST